MTHSTKTTDNTLQHCTMRSCVRPPLSCAGVPHTPPHVLSIVDIYLAQPVIPRSSFYSPRAPKCLFRQDWFNYSHRQCTVHSQCAFFTLIYIYLMSLMTQILHQSMILSLASVIRWDSFVSTNHNAWIISAQATRRAQPPIPIPILQNPYFNYRLLFCYLIFLLYNLVSNSPISFSAVSWPPLNLQVKFNAPLKYALRAQD